MGSAEAEELKDVPKTKSYSRVVCGSLRFSNDSAVVLPKGLQAVAEAFMTAEKMTGERLLILSHTDAVDSDAANETLSRQRAENALALLLGVESNVIKSSGAWVNTCKARYVTLDVQVILDDCAGQGWSKCASGARVTDAGDDKKNLTHATKRGLVWFHRYNQSEQDRKPLVTTPPTDAEIDAAKVDDKFWRAVFQRYKADIARRCNKSVAEYEKACGQIAYLGPTLPRRSAGMGERCKVVDTEEGEIANRRTEFLFFADNEEPPAAPADYAKLYDPKVYTVKKIKCEKGPPPPIRFPVEQHTLFVIDISGSMEATDGTTVDRLARCKAALVDGLDRLAAVPDSTFGIIVWNSMAAVKVGKTVKARELKSNMATAKHNGVYELIPCTPANVAAAKATVAGLVHTGNTFTQDALDLASQFVGAGGTTPEIQLVVLSDGAPTADSGYGGKVEDILESVRVWNRTSTAARPAKKWHIDTFGFAMEREPAMAKFLTDLATQNYGLFHPI